MDVHKDAISIAVLNCSGKVVMESIVETKANTILEFVHGLRGSLFMDSAIAWSGWARSRSPACAAGQSSTICSWTLCARSAW
jgi:hypothetical protein